MRKRKIYKGILLGMVSSATVIALSACGRTAQGPKEAVTSASDRISQEEVGTEETSADRQESGAGAMSSDIGDERDGDDHAPNMGDDGTQEPNPFETYSSLEEAEKAAGFSYEGLRDHLTGSNRGLAQLTPVYRAIAGDLLEVVYYGDVQGQEEALRFRKTEGIEEISGDYNVYPYDEKMDLKEGLEVRFRGNSKEEVFSAEWVGGDYSYSITMERGYTSSVADLTDMILDLMEKE